MENGDGAPCDPATNPCRIITVDEIVARCRRACGIIAIVPHPNHFAIRRVSIHMDGAGACRQIRFMNRHGPR